MKLIVSEDPSFFVYFHVTGDEHRIFYVGKGMQTLGFKRAFKRERNPFWKHVENRHGLKVCVMMNGLQESEAFFWEKFYIKLIGRRDLHRGPLVNLTDGGEGKRGAIVACETRQRIAEYMRNRVISGETLAKMKNFRINDDHRKILNESRKGIKFSDLHRSRIAEAHRGTIRDENGRKNMSLSAYREVSVCPHCNKMGKGNSMKRWHFNQCKHAPHSL